jgi:hypothetical protein
MAAEHNFFYPKYIQQCREVRGVTRHPVAKVRRIRLTHPAQIRSDTVVPFERVDLLPPHCMIQWIAMHEQDGRTFATYFNGEVDAVHHEPLQIPDRSSTRVHGPTELLRDRNWPTIAVDADKDELRTGDQGVIPDTPGSLTHGEAGSSMVSEHLLKAKYITRECGSPVVHDRLSQSRPGACASKHIHAGPPMEHLPAGALEQTEERRLIEMPEGVTLVWIDNEVDFRERHGLKIGGKAGNGGKDGRGRRRAEMISWRRASG